MKNIHVLPTEKGTGSLAKSPNTKYYVVSDHNRGISDHIDYNIYITFYEKIKEGINQWYLDKVLNEPYNSGGAQYSSKQDVIILTTDQDLIADGVQAIDDEFLQWYVKNPSCEYVEIDYDVIITQDKPLIQHQGSEPIVVPHKNTYKIIIPKEYNYIGECNGNKGNGCFMDSSGHDCGCFIRVLKEEPKQEIDTSKYTIGVDPYDEQETLEEAATRYTCGWGENDDEKAFIAGAKWQQEQDKNKFSEEEVAIAFDEGQAYSVTGKLVDGKEWVKQFKKK
jgi:hypothetical protein